MLHDIGFLGTVPIVVADVALWVDEALGDYHVPGGIKQWVDTLSVQYGNPGCYNKGRQPRIVLQEVISTDV